MHVLAGRTFTDVAKELTTLMKYSSASVKTERWQGVAANMDTKELHNVVYEIDLTSSKREHWQKDIKPNLPWADDHFLERVGGEPLNPGVQWKNWPWANSAKNFVQGRFNHSYMERLWPKFARRTDDGKLPHALKNFTRRYPADDPRPRQGLAYALGDLDDFVQLLAAEPYTRQAWIPLFFPEDTGLGDGGRKPCTLGYQIIVRSDKFGKPKAHMYYPLRSCDFTRHWRDDCYLAVRLLLWVIDKCLIINPQVWKDVTPGTLAMHMTSLHVFDTDFEAMLKEKKR